MLITPPGPSHRPLPCAEATGYTGAAGGFTVVAVGTVLHVTPESTHLVRKPDSRRLRASRGRSWAAPTAGWSTRGPGTRATSRRSSRIYRRGADRRLGARSALRRWRSRGGCQRIGFQAAGRHVVVHARPMPPSGPFGVRTSTSWQRTGSLTSRPSWMPHDRQGRIRLTPQRRPLSRAGESTGSSTPQQPTDLPQSEWCSCRHDRSSRDVPNRLYPAPPCARACYRRRSSAFRRLPYLVSRIGRCALRHVALLRRTGLGSALQPWPAPRPRPIASKRPPASATTTPSTSAKMAREPGRVRRRAASTSRSGFTSLSGCPAAMSSGSGRPVSRPLSGPNMPVATLSATAPRSAVRRGPRSADASVDGDPMGSLSVWPAAQPAGSAPVNTSVRGARSFAVRCACENSTAACAVGCRGGSRTLVVVLRREPGTRLVSRRVRRLLTPMS